LGIAPRCDEPLGNGRGHALVYEELLAQRVFNTSVRTDDNHLHHVYDKLGIPSREQPRRCCGERMGPFVAFAGRNRSNSP